MSSRSIAHLHPAFRPNVERFLHECERSNNLDVLITCTWRSRSEQTELYKIGRMIPGARCRCRGRINEIGTCAKHPMGLRVTNAKAGESRHNTIIDGIPASEALDVAPLRHGKIIWGTSGNGIDTDPTDDDTDDLELWQRLGVIGEACGMDWAGRWIQMREFPHFQRKGNL